jgi:NAD+ synthase
MRNWEQEFDKRTAFIRETVQNAGADGIVFGNSGGKDAALVGILCRAACENTIGVIMPCGSARNYGEDKEHADLLAAQFGFVNRLADLTAARDALIAAVGSDSMNIAPRLRMTALYTVAASENLLVAGTGNRSERYMGYFTKWGDGAYDFNPVADLTATEIIAFLKHLNASVCITAKAPSAGLYEGQTDEEEMGITYERLDRYLLTGEADDEDKALIERFHTRTMHKREAPVTYK